MAEKYGGPVTKHQELAQTGHAEGYAKGGSVHPSRGGHTSMKHEHQHKGHGTHGHKEPHVHHTSPGSGESGHKGHGIHSLVHHGKNTPEFTEHTYTGEPDEGAAHHGGSGGHSTGGTRNRL
jgi:hypothetical protein